VVYKDPEKRRERDRRYREKNRERILARRRESYAASPKRREQNREWRKANPEKARESSRKYAQANREKIHANYIDNRDTILESNRKWREKNPDKKRESDRKYRQANHDKLIEAHRSWHIKNIEKDREYHRRGEHIRRARMRGNHGTLPIDSEAILFEQQEGFCYLCGRLLYGKLDDIPSIEHKTPISRGGPNIIENVGLAHLSCNLRKYTKTAEEFMELLKWAELKNI